MIGEVPGGVHYAREAEEEAGGCAVLPAKEVGSVVAGTGDACTDGLGETCVNPLEEVLQGGGGGVTTGWGGDEEVMDVLEERVCGEGGSGGGEGEPRGTVRR